MNNPFDYIPDRVCHEAFRELCGRLEALKNSGRPDDVNFIRELEAGKMLGVLIADGADGVRHTLYAFSGQLGHGGFHYPGFVGPVFDYLQPDGHFKTHERDISRQNLDISRFETDILPPVRKEYERVRNAFDAEVSAARDKYRESKSARDARRKAGDVSDAELAAMIRQSQLEKAELHRLKKRVTAQLEPYATRLKEAEAQLSAMKEKRRADSEALQQWLFTNFRLLNARGESRSLSEIFADTPMPVPPSGAGECCAPKLLQAAYLQGWHPLAIAEYWYGRGKEGEVRIHGRHYPACRGKCRPVLGWMLQGLVIKPPLDSDCDAGIDLKPVVIFENQWFCVVDKPSGILSVPGKGTAISVQQWLEAKYGPERDVKVVHRLDQDTSGLLIAAFGPVAYKALQFLFATRQVKKTYVADLEGDYQSRGIPQKGRIELPLSPDWLDRPRQRVDLDTGKDAVTGYEFLSVKDGHTRVEFHPLTGRTHQLRVHAASDAGLGMPIVGDRLYGHGNDCPHNSRRLRLHAMTLEFTSPFDRRPCRFDSPLPF
jgi:tRNA pseudouridine32 synthase/23S rRNA pseudouridine746 synthase